PWPQQPPPSKSLLKADAFSAMPHSALSTPRDLTTRRLTSAPTKTHSKPSRHSATCKPPSSSPATITGQASAPTRSPHSHSKSGHTQTTTIGAEHHVKHH